MLGPGLIRKEKVNNEDLMRPIVILPNVIELTYYSNTLVAHYALECIVSTALEVLDKSSGSVFHEELVASVIELCNILQYEFLLCKPCQTLEQVINTCIDDLTYRKQIFLLVSVLSSFSCKCDLLTCHLNPCVKFSSLK